VPEGFRNADDVRVRFAETDAQGIAHHASYVVWLEVARVAYLADHAGGYRSIREQGIEALTIGVRVDYRTVAVFDDVLTVHVRCVDLRGARFRYEYRLERAGELIATAETLRNRRRDDDATDADPALVRRGELGLSRRRRRRRIPASRRGRRVASGRCGHGRHPPCPWRASSPTRTSVAR
jgi:acyl-CoA thioester hydrolase